MGAVTTRALRGVRAGIDLTYLAVAYAAAFYLRFETIPPPEIFDRMLLTWPVVVVAKYLLLAAFGIPRTSWRHVSLRDATRIFVALSIPTAVLLAIRLSAATTEGDGILVAGSLPLGVILIDFVLAFFAITGMRVAWRLWCERTESRGRVSSPDERATILIGAGQAGVIVAREIAARPDLGIKPVGFLDDDPRKLGMTVYGIRVMGVTADIQEVCARTGATQVLITVANAEGKDIRRIVSLCEEAGVSPKIIPGVHEIVGGQVSLSRIRDVDIDDLLGREAVELDMDAIAEQLRDRVVVVTGAGGSIGSELCRQIARFEPRRLVLLEQAEPSLFEIDRELSEAHPDVAFEPCVGDVCDAGRIRDVFTAQRPDIVFHAAAHKHVPLMEANPGEAVKNNVFGAKVAVDVAHEMRVGSFVLVSTDKAVNPASVMGATKRIAEVYAQAVDRVSPTRFITVRFGNVLDSAGSVVRVFRRQIANGGPVTVTHPGMMRYFMTIPEACQLILQAGSMGDGGEIYVLDMGEPVRIVDLAQDLIRLSGFTAQEDIGIVYTGIRPGEKLFEQLSLDGEAVTLTHHPKIYIGHSIDGHPLDRLQAQLADLRAACETGDRHKVRAQMAAVVPEYRPADGPGGNGDHTRTPKAEATRLDQQTDGAGETAAVVVAAPRIHRSCLFRSPRGSGASERS
jgi:FlaA1/EpsC-like NDP-sugar epimerase